MKLQWLANFSQLKLTVRQAFIFAIGVGIAATVAAAFGKEVPAPPAWLFSWVGLIAAIVTLLAGKEIVRGWIRTARGSGTTSEE